MKYIIVLKENTSQNEKDNLIRFLSNTGCEYTVNDTTIGIDCPCGLADEIVDEVSAFDCVEEVNPE